MASPLPATVVGNRFEIEAEGGRGGMATVYVARDLTTGARVALKILDVDNGVSGDRFRQEATLLAELRHPAIVRYIDHGASPSGAPYLAMEWLEGETLEQRLAAGRPTLGLLPTLRLAERMLDALGFAHERGVIHRDLKPANLFLPGGSLEAVKLLDFGIARRGAIRRTGAQIAVGTPMYMSPEQARGEADLDARSDLFSLGAILVECLTGASPFQAETDLAVMVKICLEPLDLPALCRGVPEPVLALLSDMLSKRREGRPASAAAAASRVSPILDGLAAAEPDAAAAGTAARGPRSARPVLTVEQRILSAVMLAPPAQQAAGAARDQGELRATVAAALDQLPVRIHQFVGGAMLITMLGQGTPLDQATQAGRCALSLRQVLPDAAFAISTGRAMIGDDLPVGEVVGRSTVLLAAQQPGAIVIDLPTAALLERNFAIVPGEGCARLVSERSALQAVDVAPTRQGTCVGRERELGNLLGILDECIDEPVARAALVTSPAGRGKSRLCRELVQRARARDGQFQLLFGRGDPIRADAPFALIGSAVRGAAGITDNEPAAVQKGRLTAMVARHFADEPARRVAAFLGEIARVTFSEEELPALRSAREDPRVMADQTLAAWLDWLEAECQAGAVMLVLDDLHWGDGPSVDFVDAALRTLRDRPFMVAGLSRPEVDQRFPNLWAERDVQRLALGPLTPKSCQKLVQQLLPGLDPERAAWIVERADGNAFYLEELVRAARDGVDLRSLSNLPDSVLGMVQARFDALGKYARRVLRAASVYGQSFSADGVNAIVEDAAAVEAALDLLEAREVVLGQPGPGDRQFAFRHGLLRDAAYQMLTEDDQRLAHGRAGDFLERRGEPNAIVLVEHFERGGAPERAMRHCEKAAAQALEANDLKSAIERAARGIQHGAQGEARGGLRLVEARARYYSGEYPDSEAAAREAVALNARQARLAALGELVAALGQQHRIPEMEALLAEARAWPERLEHLAAWYLVLVRASGWIHGGGRLALAEEILDEVERCAPLGDPAIRGHFHQGRGLIGLATARLAASAAHFRQAVSAFEAAGDFRMALEARCNVAAAIGSGGQLPETERELRELLALADRMNLSFLDSVLRHNLGLVQADLGDLDGGRASVERGLEIARRQGDRRIQDYCLKSLSIIATRAGRFQEAETLARDPAANTMVSLRPLAAALLAGALLGQGRVAEALVEAREANRLLDEQGYVEDGEALVRLSLVDCLLAAGEGDAAREAAARAYRRLQERAGAIDDPRWRVSFLGSMPDHRRTVEVARTLGVADAA
jgi:eukaryotic-like serine/threonine-protein kinase